MPVARCTQSSETTEQIERDKTRTGEPVLMLAVFIGEGGGVAEEFRTGEFLGEKGKEIATLPGSGGGPGEVIDTGDIQADGLPNGRLNAEPLGD